MFKFFLLLNPLYVTLFWSLLLLLNPKKNNVPKVFLGKFMFVAALLYLSHLFYYLPLLEGYYYMDSFYQLCSLLVYPMYYIYIRLLTVDKKFSLKKHGVYLLIPSLLFMLYGMGILFMSKEMHFKFIYEMMVYNLPVSGIFLYQKIVLSCCRVVFSIQGFVYLTLSILLIIRNRAKIHNYYANTEEYSLDKILLLTITLTVTIILGLIISFIQKENFLYNEKRLIVPSVLFTILYFFIGWLGNKQRSVVICDETNAFEEAKNTFELSDNFMYQHVHIRKKIQMLFEDEKIYLNKDLTLNELSRIVGTNRTYISTIINNDFNQNFSSFVNSYRVKYAQMLISQNRYLKNNDLADLSGFGSVASMQRAFLACKGVSLKQARNNDNKESQVLNEKLKSDL